MADQWASTDEHAPVAAGVWASTEDHSPDADQPSLMQRILAFPEKLLNETGPLQTSRAAQKMGAAPQYNPYYDVPDWVTASARQAAKGVREIGEPGVDPKFQAAHDI